MGLFIKNPTMDSPSNSKLYNHLVFKLHQDKTYDEIMKKNLKNSIKINKQECLYIYLLFFRHPEGLPCQDKKIDWGSMMAEEKSRIVYGILAILLGGLGIHKFYMGNVAHGVFYILLSCVGVGGVLGLVSGILALIKTDEEFHQKYVVEESFI
jgi:TM2 domain-containing membrane protein YozV